MIEEYGIYQITSLTGIRNEFDVIMNDPDDVASGIAIDYDPLPQEISFLVPKRHYYNREVIDAVYDNTVYDMKNFDNMLVSNFPCKIDNDSKNSDKNNCLFYLLKDVQRKNLIYQLSRLLL